MASAPTGEYDFDLFTIGAGSGGVRGHNDAPMLDAHLVSLKRIQNPSLYTFFNFHKQRLEMGAENPALLERDEDGALTAQRVWHGTGKFPAHNIYEDKKVGAPPAASRAIVSLLGARLTGPDTRLRFARSGWLHDAVWCVQFRT